MNIFAILLASLIAMGLGMLWYSPNGFGNAWIKAMGWDPKVMAKKMKNSKMNDMAPTIFANVVSNIIMFVVLANLIYALTITSAVTGAFFGLLVWAGFVATSSLNPVLWEGKTVKAYLIFNGYSAVMLAVGGAIIAAW